jgi:superfamily II DNA or RNA helicase
MNYELRPHQTIVLNEIRERLTKKKKRILVSAPTGFGKTILAYEIAKNAIAKGKKVLFTNHRIALAKQSFDKFRNLNPSLLQGSNKDFENYNLLVATLQTLIDTEIETPDIVIFDEVHYGYENNLIQSVFKKFTNAIFIGLSATPIDDNGFILSGFDAIVDNYQTKDLIDIGFLTPFRCFAPMSATLPKKEADFTESELEESIVKFDFTKSIVKNYKKLGENRKFICFAVNKKHCLELKKVFEFHNINTEIIDADTSTKDRERSIYDLQKGYLQGLISIEILTAGFDEPSVSCVIMATATKSWKKYIQCAGRGIRLLGHTIDESITNGKPDCIFLDCCGNIEEHGLPDEKREFKFGTKISRVIDKVLNIDKVIDSEIKMQYSEEKQVFLKKIGKLLDLYDGKVYAKESELQEDVNKFLDKTGFFYFRQNSGKAYIEGRWVSFTSKAGLPDCTVYYKNTSFFFGIELKLKHGRLTEKQKETLPEMIQNNVLFFICESVLDVYLAISHVENNIVFESDKTIILNSIYELPERQFELRKKLKLQ